MAKKEKKKPCNCGKRTLQAVARYTDEGEELLKKSLLRKIWDFILTIFARIFASVLFIIIGLIVVPIFGIVILFTGTNDYGINITKLIDLSKHAKR